MHGCITLQSNLTPDPNTRWMADLRHRDLRLQAEPTIQLVRQIDPESQQIGVHELGLHGVGRSRDSEIESAMCDAARDEHCGVALHGYQSLPLEDHQYGQ